jgi:hypothetical protein
VYRSERALHGHPVTRARSARYRLGPVGLSQKLLGELVPIIYKGLKATA